MRDDLIDDYLREHYLGIGVAVSAATPEEYKILDHRPEKRLGIYGPLPYPIPGKEEGPDDPPFLMVWCPRYIDRLLSDKSDEVLEHYMQIITYVGDMMIALNTEVPDIVERYRKIEYRFVDEWPDSAELMNEIELRVLDSQEAK